MERGWIRSSHLRAAARVALAAAWFALCVPVQAAALAAGSRLAARFPPVFHRGVCRIFGIRVRSVGGPCGGGPVLFVGNHASWLDIVVMGALAPASFVAKAEIAGWPFFGWLAKLQRSVFVDRRRSRAGVHGRALVARLAAGDSIVVFPEGTSGDGNRVRRFRSSMFVLPEGGGGGGVQVQPFSICYSGLNGLPLARRNRPLLAWTGEAELLPHIWRALGLARIEVTVTFHPPCPAGADRKKLALIAERRVADGLSRALSGRPRPAAAGA